MAFPAAGVVVTTYLGILGRAPENAGLEFWNARLEALQAQFGEDEASLRLITEIETAARAGGELSTEGEEPASFVANLYRNLLGREPDAGGLDFWSQLLAQGLSRETLFTEFLTTLGTLGGEDNTALNNRAEVAEAFSRAENSGPDVLPTLTVDAVQVLNGVTADPETVAAALDQLPTGGGGTDPDVPPPIEPDPPAPTFGVTKDASDVVTFSNAGTSIAVTKAGDTYTFTSSGGTTGTGSVVAPIDVVTVGPGITLSGAADTLHKVVTAGPGNTAISGSEGTQSLVVRTTGTNTIAAGQGPDSIHLGLHAGAFTGTDTLGFQVGGSAPEFSATVSFGDLTAEAEGNWLSITVNDVSYTATYTDGTWSDFIDVASNALARSLLEESGDLVLTSDATFTVSAASSFIGSGEDAAEITVIGLGEDIDATEGVTFATSDSHHLGPDRITNFDVGTDKLNLGSTEVFASADGWSIGSLAFSVTNGIVEVTGDTSGFGSVAELTGYVLFETAMEMGNTNAVVAYLDGTDTYVLRNDGVAGLEVSDIVVVLSGVELINVGDALFWPG